MTDSTATRKAAVLAPEGIRTLLEALARRGHRLLGPSIREEALVLEEITPEAGIPAGWAVEESAGSYRLGKSGDGSLFSHGVGPHSWKRFLHLPDLPLWRARREGGEMEIAEEPRTPERLALVGVRPCDLAAIRVQDRVFLEGRFVDIHYRARREGAFIVALSCVRPGGTCFCASMGTGPGADGGYDICLTEVAGGGHPRLVAEAGTPAGEEVLGELPGAPAAERDLEAARAAVREASGRMGRALDTSGLKEALAASLEHPRWDEVEGRCLACGNCTLVCPTCFCTTVEDVTDLAGTSAERRRKWDSCYSMEFSYIYGGHIRRSIRARYRQWLTHKLSTWWDQFGTAGCVGCGRCISWCPAAIDITEEARAIRENGA